MRLVDIEDACDACEIGSHELVSLVGGGGKTTLLFALGRALTGRVILTTTTKMSATRDDGMAVLRNPSDDAIASVVGVTLAWSYDDGPKAIGVGPTSCDRWFELVDHVVVEADGARRRPFKAPAAYEPVVPSATTTVIAVIGADALDRVIEDQCHRPLRVAAVAGCGSYERLTPERAARVLMSESGSRQGVPAGARFVVAITKVDEANAALAARVAHAIEHAVEDAVDIVVGIRAAPGGSLPG